MLAHAGSVANLPDNLGASPSPGEAGLGRGTGMEGWGEPPARHTEASHATVTSLAFLNLNFSSLLYILSMSK